MEDWVHVHKTVPTPLDHSSAAVCLDILCLEMPAMVSNKLYAISLDIDSIEIVSQYIIRCMAC